MAKTATSDVDPIDGGLLATLDARGREYGPVLAHEFGIERTAVERRCARLATRGLVERVSEEPLYRITPEGHAFLANRGVGPTLATRT